MHTNVPPLSMRPPAPPPLMSKELRLCHRYNCYITVPSVATGSVRKQLLHVFLLFRSEKVSERFGKRERVPEQRPRSAKPRSNLSVLT